MKIRNILCSFAILPLAGGSVLANDARPAPTLDELRGTKVVSVTPVLTTGNRTAAYRRLGAHMASAPTTAAVAVSPILAPSVEGFGFAGQATVADVMLLNVGAAMGSAMVAKQLGGDHFTNVINSVQNHRAGAIASLSPAVLEQVDRFIAAAKGGEVDLDATIKALAHAEAGIAAGPARAHGYFTVGLWLGLTSVFVANGLDARELADMSGPLSNFLEQDAAFGGADTKLATEVRAIGRALSSEKADKDAWHASMMRALEVKPDAQ